MNPQAWLVVILSICAATQSSYILSAQSTTTPKQDSATAKSPMQLVAQYRGVHPCADCPGIDTTLSLLANSPNDLAHTRYVLKSSYQERSNTFTGTGTVDHRSRHARQSRCHRLPTETQERRPTHQFPPRERQRNPPTRQRTPPHRLQAKFLSEKNNEQGVPSPPSQRLLNIPAVSKQRTAARRSFRPASICRRYPIRSRPEL